jgi:hypothetical protein
LREILAPSLKYLDHQTPKRHQAAWRRSTGNDSHRYLHSSTAARKRIKARETARRSVDP